MIIFFVAIAIKMATKLPKTSKAASEMLCQESLLFYICQKDSLACPEEL